MTEETALDGRAKAALARFMEPMPGIDLKALWQETDQAFWRGVALAQERATPDKPFSSATLGDALKEQGLPA